MSSYDLKQFRFERVLNQDPITHALTLLGTMPSSDAAQPAPAILRIEKTALPVDSAEHLVSLLQSSRLIESTDIYTWLFGWLQSSPDLPDVKINVIHPATEVHIRKYSTQEWRIFRETPAIYDRVVKPYITAFPPSRTKWVENILDGTSEADKILFRDPSPTLGYVLLPDMKWDLSTIGSLYLVAIAHDRGVRSLRDLTQAHLPMLASIRREAVRVVHERWGLAHGSLRMFVHYQPSYYHFHVHVVNVNYQGLPGMSAGQAHLLDDIVSLLECSPDEGPSVLQRMTLTYALGEQHGLYEPLKMSQEEVE